MKESVYIYHKLKHNFCFYSMVIIHSSFDELKNFKFYLFYNDYTVRHGDRITVPPVRVLLFFFLGTPVSSTKEDHNNACLLYICVNVRTLLRFKLKNLHSSTYYTYTGSDCNNFMNFPTYDRPTALHIENIKKVRFDMIRHIWTMFYFSAYLTQKP